MRAQSQKRATRYDEPTTQFERHARRPLHDLACLGLVMLVACNASASADDGDDGIHGIDSTTTDGAREPSGDDGTFEPTLDVGSNDDGGGTTPVEDPKTCAEAAERRTYIGCEFWPTVTANVVKPLFDFAVVVANVGDETAEVEVERGGTLIETVSIPPNELRTIYLPWVNALKGVHGCMESFPHSAPTARVPDGAYRVVSSRPVVAYQFNPLQYKPAGGPPGKDWDAACSTSCDTCTSQSNDASLLLPTTALTTNYRVTAYQDGHVSPFWIPIISSKLAVTGTKDGTTVKVALSKGSAVQEGAGLPTSEYGDVLSFSLDRGEVVQLSALYSQDDFSGSLIQSDQPIQVLFASPCRSIEGNTCDHLEESVFPVETWGQRYFVTVPTAPGGQRVGHHVVIYGNVDGTKLTYPSGKPTHSLPDTIDAGQVVAIRGNPGVTEDFEIRGDHEFAVATFQLSVRALSPEGTNDKGDPSYSNVTAVEQFRNKYVFLAPLDYAENYVDVIQPMDADVYLDGVPASGSLTEIGQSGYGVRRVLLGEGKGGAHVLEADQPVGIQVVGYGDWTSYQFPGGLNLETIAPPPPPIP